MHNICLKYQKYHIFSYIIHSYYLLLSIYSYVSWPVGPDFQDLAWTEHQTKWFQERTTDQTTTCQQSIFRSSQLPTLGWARIQVHVIHVITHQDVSWGWDKQPSHSASDQKWHGIVSASPQYEAMPRTNLFQTHPQKLNILGKGKWPFCYQWHATLQLMKNATRGHFGLPSFMATVVSHKRRAFLGISCLENCFRCTAWQKMAAYVPFHFFSPEGDEAREHLDYCAS